MRSIGSAIISFGLVSIPVKLYTAASAETISFNMLTPKGNRIRQKIVDSVTGEEVQNADCLKGYEIAKDQYVQFTKDELKSLEAESEAKAIAITEFVEAGSVDPIGIEKSYYLGPDKGGDRAFMLLSEAMTAMGRVAVAQWNFRGREHLVVIRSYKGGLVLHQMFYVTEVRNYGEIEVATKLTVGEAERSMAAKLITSLSTGDFDPSKYADTYAARVKQAIDEKFTSGTFKTSAAAPKTASVLDLFSVLKASLDQEESKKGGKPKGSKGKK